jgi:hypothetical protein
MQLCSAGGVWAGSKGLSHSDANPLAMRTGPSRQRERSPSVAANTATV